MPDADRPGDDPLASPTGQVESCSELSPAVEFARANGATVLEPTSWWITPLNAYIRFLRVTHEARREIREIRAPERAARAQEAEQRRRAEAASRDQQLKYERELCDERDRAERQRIERERMELAPLVRDRPWLMVASSPSMAKAVTRLYLRLALIPAILLGTAAAVCLQTSHLTLTFVLGSATGVTLLLPAVVATASYFVGHRRGQKSEVGAAEGHASGSSSWVIRAAKSLSPPKTKGTEGYGRGTSGPDEDGAPDENDTDG